MQNIEEYMIYILYFNCVSDVFWTKYAPSHDNKRK